MSEFNDYKWYNDESDIAGKQSFYTETVNTKKQKKGKIRNAILVSLCAIITLSSVATTGYVLINGSPAIKNSGNANNVHSALDQEAAYDFQQLTDGERKAMSTVDIAANVGPSVVGIICKTEYMTFFGQRLESSGSGSGIIITSDGYIATNNHVVEGAKSVSVILNTGEEYEAKIVGRDPKTDLAVIKVEATDLAVATLGDSAKCQVGELAVAIGNPLGQELAGTVTVGVISAVNRTIQTSDDGTTMSLLQTDAAINPGNSGGALVNAYGEIIGINSMKFSGENVEGIGFAIPMNSAKPIISDLISAGYVKGRPLIGISLREISPEIAAINDLPAGLYVAEVAVGGAAEKAGIKAGDIITAVDGKIIETAKQVNEIRDTHKAGDTIKITVNRDGETKTFDVILLEDTSSRVSN